MNQIVPVFIVGIIFSAIYGVIKLVTHRNERLLMIEKGAGLPEFKGDRTFFSSLKFGILFIGLGLGILIANIIAVTTTLDREVAYFSMIFLSGGVSLIVYHLLEGRNVEK